MSKLTTRLCALTDLGAINKTDSLVIRFIAAYGEARGLECALSNQNMTDAIASEYGVKISRERLNKSLNKLTEYKVLRREEQILDRLPDPAKSSDKRVKKVKNFKYKVGFDFLFGQCTKVVHCDGTVTQYVFTSYEVNTVAEVAKRHSGDDARNKRERRHTPAADAIEATATPTAEQRPSTGANTPSLRSGSVNSLERPSPDEGAPDVSNTFMPTRESTAAQTSVELSEARLRAAKLEEALRRANKLQRHSLDKWARDMRAWIKYYGVDRVDRALDWYCNNLRGQFTPKAYCAFSFGDKLLKIENQMERAGFETPVELSDSAKELLAEIRSWFSGENAVRLPQVIQRTYDAAIPFHARLKELAPTNDLARMLTQRWRGYGVFVREWFVALSETHFNKPDTFAKITNYTFSVENKFTDALLSRLAGETTGRSADWIRLKEVL